MGPPEYKAGVPATQPRCIVLSLYNQNAECNRIRYTTLKIYCDQTNTNITTQFLTEHFLTLQLFYKCSIWLPWLCGRHPDDILIDLAAAFHGHPDHPTWHPWTSHSGDSWKIMWTYHPGQWTFKSFVTGLLTPQLWYMSLSWANCGSN
jgi:hypothetical protein